MTTVRVSDDSPPMTKVHKIPSPPRALWNEFRVRFAPVAAWLGALAVAAAIWRGEQAPAEMTGQVAFDQSVVAYVRPPMSHPPTPNMEVVVKRRSKDHKSAKARVLAVGKAAGRPNAVDGDGSEKSRDRGLPVRISAPPGLGLSPGEWVDVSTEE
jgi:hypothetical protein